MDKKSLHLDMNDKILAGVDLTMKYLGSSKLSRGTDDEIAQIIHEIHSIYAQKKNSINKAREVVVLIDSQRINIYGKNVLADEIMMSFPLTNVRDVTVCVRHGAYSKTCVLVAKGPYAEMYRAYVFYTKSVEKASEFYQITSLAFEVGFKLFEKFGTERLGEEGDLTVEQDSDGKESDKLNLLKDSDSLKVNTYEDIADNKVVRRTSTVRIPTENASWNQDNDFINTDCNNDLSPSKMVVYMESVEQRSRFILTRWFRNSYRKFQRISGRKSPEEDEELQYL